jgi:acyl-CoA synthetase (NDP forming)
MSRLKAALDPRSVAIIGASENPNKVGMTRGDRIAHRQ